MTKTPRLALGTAQLGLHYGAANSTGMPSEDEAVALVRAAIDAGIATIDTARAYGDAERRIGLALQGIDPSRATVVTKLDPLAGVSGDDAAAAAAAAKRSIETSRTLLHQPRLDALLLHRAEHRTKWNGAVWQTLLAERDAGRIGQLGVSVQSPEELHDVITDAAVARVQLPYNLLDHRWDEAHVRAALGQRPDIVVDTRSALLQGLLSGAATARWPSVSGLSPETLLTRIRALAEQFGRASTTDLSLAFVRAQDWIDNIVIGVETKDQLERNLTLFGTPRLDREALAEIRRALPRLPIELLDPSRWTPSSPAGHKD